MAAPTHARIGVYRGQPDKLDAAVARAQQELVPMLQQQPGFRRYLGVRTGADGVISVSGWDAREQAEAAGQRLSGWVREAMGPALTSVEDHIGELAHVTEASEARPGFARFALFQLKPGQQEALRHRVEGEFVPQLQRQPGFIRYVVWQTGPDRVIAMTHYASRAEGEAAAAAIQGWVQQHVAPAVVSVQRQEGEVLWAVRKD